MSTEPTYGNPSSHASDSLAVQGYLASRVKKTWFWVIVVFLVFFISISRLYLGVHFPQDTLFGWVIGLFVLWTLSQWGDEVVDWFRSASLSAQIGIGFVVSLVIALTGILIRLIISGIPDPVSWSSFSTQARSIDHFITLSGALFGMIAGYALTRQYARFSAKGDWGKRLIRYILGIVGLLLLYYGLDLVFSAIAPDETTLGYLLRYIRYGAATFWATFLAPWIFLKTRLADLESG
ncbi:MAG: phosphatase PAP2 family protein [Anaerolineae bacterium]|nr:phosphatase PAP2 family protein [Anaerolineae bacterium]